MCQFPRHRPFHTILLSNLIISFFFFPLNKLHRKENEYYHTQKRLKLDQNTWNTDFSPSKILSAASLFVNPLKMFHISDLGRKRGESRGEPVPVSRFARQQWVIAQTSGDPRRLLEQLRIPRIGDREEGACVASVSRPARSLEQVRNDARNERAKGRRIFEGFSSSFEIMRFVGSFFLQRPIDNDMSDRDIWIKTFWRFYI